MNIELEEVVQDISDDALEMAAGSAQGGVNRGVFFRGGVSFRSSGGAYWCG